MSVVVELPTPSPVPETAQVGRVMNAAAVMHRMSYSTDANAFDTASNGLPSPPTRASPLPQFEGMSNGKVDGPFFDRTGSSTPIPQTVSSPNPKIAAAAASDMRNIVRRKLTGFVGFANLPNQWHRKSVRKGFNFNVMVVGKIRWSQCATHACNTDMSQVNLVSESLRS